MQITRQDGGGTEGPVGLFRMAPSGLKLGHRVVELDCGWNNSPYSGPFLFIESFEQRKLLSEVCQWVLVDVAGSVNQVRPKGLRVEPLQESLPVLPDRIDWLRNSQLTSSSMQMALRIYLSLSRRVDAFLLSFSRTGQLDPSQAVAISKILARAQKLSLAALIWLTRIKNRRYYQAQHCVNTAILMAGFIYALKWDSERVEMAALIGLLHDIGKSRLDPRLLQKTERLTDEELNLIRTHPVIGYELLRANPELAWEVTAAIHASHERPDGEGHPRGLSGDAIPLLARAIAIVDAYDAMTSARPHVEAMTHQQALGVLWKERGRQFDQRLTEAFIQFLGRIPPGTLVRLSDQRLAIATEIETQGSMQPRVQPIEGTPADFDFGQEILLPPLFVADGQASLRIEEVLPDGAAGFSMLELTRRLFQTEELADAPAPSLLQDDPPSVERPFSARQTLKPPPTEDKPWAGAVDPEPELPPREVHQGGPSCLVVDDSLTARTLLGTLLQREGFHVRSVESGEQALTELDRCPADLVFLDILLPGMSGFSVLRKFRQAKLLDRMPVVMISASPQAAEQFFVESIGADDFLLKPFERADLVACLERLSRSARLNLPNS